MTESEAMLLGPNGAPIHHKRAAPPALGPAYGDWIGREAVYNSYPGATMLGYDLDRLTLADFRQMRTHPQVNASLSALTFMIHQIEWRIECKDKKIQAEVEENIRDKWTRLIRGVSQAFWAGYSPCVLEYESNKGDGLPIILNKVKDLVPEDCSPHWKLVEGAIPPGSASTIPPKLKVYDGIKQWGAPGPIPADNTLWYPLLMENGDFYGRKLLKAAFTPWYFSTLIHLYSNRYYERFGEPTPIGRAPFEEELVLPDGSIISGKEVMDRILGNIRNRSSINLPSSRDPVSKEYDYGVSYLESTMRGADFERYLDRLDEEISLSLFTPLLLLKTAGEGSNNLGVQHTATWLWMLNAIAGDLSEYFTLLTDRLKAINYSPNAPTCKWVPVEMGRKQAETMRGIVTELIRGGKAKPNVEELGKTIGLTLEEINEATQPDTTETNGVQNDARIRTERDRSRSSARGVNEERDTENPLEK